MTELRCLLPHPSRPLHVTAPAQAAAAEPGWQLGCLDLHQSTISQEAWVYWHK